MHLPSTTRRFSRSKSRTVRRPPSHFFLSAHCPRHYGSSCAGGNSCRFASGRPGPWSIVGGAAALETTQIEEIEEVAWEELMPECLWKFRVKDFGPLWVGIDAHGSSMYRDVQQEATRRLEDIVGRL